LCDLDCVFDFAINQTFGCVRKRKNLNQCHLELYPLHGMNKSFSFLEVDFVMLPSFFLVDHLPISKFLRLKTSKFEGSFSSRGSP
jgi:hypothetical protein